MKRILLATLCFSLLGNVHAYKLTEKDWKYVDQLLEVIDEKIIKPGHATPDLIIDRFITLYETGDVSDRLLAIIDELIYELEFEYEDQIDQQDDVLMESDCYDDEYYDPDEQWCFPLEQQVVDVDIPVSGDFHHTVHDAILRYQVHGDSIKIVHNEARQDVQDKARQVWATIVSIFPESLREDVAEYEVSYNETSDTTAHVQQTQDDPERWLINVNIAAFYPDQIYNPTEAIYTLIHEFGHLFTLDNSQVYLIGLDVSEAQYQRLLSTCKNIFVQEWCLKKEAYLQSFITQFWNQKDLDIVWSWSGGDVYEDNENAFVTDYAATNPGEDIAESFAHYVLKQQEHHPKVQFFDRFPAVQRLARVIRKNIAKQ